MGDPRRLRNKFERPKKLWELDRLKHDKALKVEYGLKNMSELWAITAHLKKYRREARRLLSLNEEERKADEPKILNKLVRMGVMKEGGRVEDILSLEVRAFLERRLQTLVQRKGLGRTTRQCRQLVTHGFISVGGRKVSTPGYLVSSDEESTIMYSRPIDLSVPSESGAAEAPAAATAPAVPQPAAQSGAGEGQTTA